jgi:spore coat protein CotF
MENYLLVLKSTMEVYVHGTLESSNSYVRDALKMGLDETVIHQANTYKEMTKKGWYVINNIDTKTIKQIINKLENKN